MRRLSFLRVLTNNLNNTSEVLHYNQKATFKKICLTQQSMLISQTSSSSAKPNVHEVAPEKRPANLVANQNNILKEEIHEVLSYGNEQNAQKYLQSNDGDIHEISKYYFDGRGKGIRPRICLSLAEAVNCHLFGDDNPILVDEIMKKQRRIAQISEMYHTGSLYHDDVIDKSEERRSRPSVNYLWGSKRSIMSGDYVVSMANKILADLNNDEVKSFITFYYIIRLIKH